MRWVFNVRWLQAIDMDNRLVNCDALAKTLVIIHGQGRYRVRARVRVPGVR